LEPEVLNKNSEKSNDQDINVLTKELFDKSWGMFNIIAINGIN
jgi:hypothetical protein